jgi:hypothetical protein
VPDLLIVLTHAKRSAVALVISVEIPARLLNRYNLANPGIRGATELVLGSDCKAQPAASIHL